MRVARLLALSSAALALLLLEHCGIVHRASHVPQVIVLGIDGMDPGFVEQHWADLPNLRALRDRGRFSRLATTTPPQSPVAWSSFITGLDPAEHGIFDFVHRNPQTLEPFSSLSRTEEPRFTLPLGPYSLPLTASRVISLRHGTPFWQTLSDHGVPVTIIRMPTNYPPVTSGHAISGMGTPDLSGTLGTFTFYTNDPDEISRDVSGGHIVKVRLDQGHGDLKLNGPPNSLRKDHAISTANLVIDVDPEHAAMRLLSGDQAAILRQGEWSDWLTANFQLIPHLASVRGTFRAFVKQLHPLFELYISAINIDPADPALPISAPSSWARKIALSDGPFFTLGIPEDTSALRQGVFTLREFLRQTELVSEDERHMLHYALRQYHDGLLFFYFSSIDQSSHILWERHVAELLDKYREVDRSVGEVMSAFPSADLIVLSDHGFTSFDRAVNLNTWLNDHGFLRLKESPSDQTTLHSIDWARTEAYAIGLNALYLNRKGRERFGTLSSNEQIQTVTSTLRQQLLAWKDPATGRQVVEAVYPVNPSPENASVAPDFIVGYARGYRASWQTGLGATPAEEITSNDDAWIGDHCVNPVDVAGVLFTNWRTTSPPPRLRDVTAMILSRFGLPPG